MATVATVLNLEPSALTDESGPESVEAWDSLNHLNIAMAVETEFGVTLTAQQVVDMASLRLIRQTLRDQGVDI